MHPAPKKILVGDGDGIVLALICYILRREGYTVEPATDPRHLFRLMQDGDYDALVVDADLDGVLEIVKTCPPPRAGRIILTSPRDCAADGVHATLKKPLEFGELIDTVRDCVTPGE